jgi:hypothetical protein
MKTEDNATGTAGTSQPDPKGAAKGSSAPAGAKAPAKPKKSSAASGVKAKPKAPKKKLPEGAFKVDGKAYAFRRLDASLIAAPPLVAVARKFTGSQVLQLAKKGDKIAGKVLTGLVKINSSYIEPLND